MSIGIVVQGPSPALKLYGALFLLSGWSLNLRLSSRQRAGGSDAPGAFAAKLETWFSKPWTNLMPATAPVLCITASFITTL